MEKTNATTRKRWLNPKRLKERALFFQKFLLSPKEVGSIIPSSRFLTRQMIQPLKWDEIRSIAELGAGTGVFTRSIYNRKKPECQALIFEQDRDMRKRLAVKYPDMEFCGDAQELTDELQKRGISELDAVVSGLPFANFKPELRDCILSEVVQSLKPGGMFVTFQYSLQMRKHLQAYFSKVEIRFVPLNVPSAFVYVCHK